jgi:hypothetical protein
VRNAAGAAGGTLIYDSNKDASTNKYSLDSQFTITKLSPNGPPDVIGPTINRIFNVLAYGAKCDASTDDQPKIQALLDTICNPSNGNNNFGTATIFFPPPSALNATCLVKKPLLVRCGGVELFGAGGATIGMSVRGYSVDVIHAQTANIPLAASLVSGPGNSLSFNGTSFQEINLNDLFSFTGDAVNSGLSNYTIDGWVNVPTVSADGSIVTTAGGLPGSIFATNTNADITWTSDGRLQCRMNTSGSGQVTVQSAAGVFTAATTHYFAMVLDGTNHLLSCYLDNNRVASATANGTYTKQPYTDLAIGEVPGQFPDVLGGAYALAAKKIDGVRISNAARWTTATITAPTAKFTDDGSTLALLNNDVVDGPLIQDDHSLGWLVERNANEQIGPANEYIHDLNFSGGGIFAEGAFLSVYRKLQMTASVMNLFRDNFDSSLSDISWVPTGRMWSFLSSAQNSNLTINNLQFGAASALPWFCGGCSGVFNGLQVTTDTPSVVGPIWANGATITINNMNSDIEVANSKYLAGLILHANNAVLVNGGSITATNAAPPIVVNASNSGVTINGPQLANFGSNPPEEVHIVNPGLTQPVVIENVKPFTGGIPMCDGPCQVIGKAGLKAPAASSCGTGAAVGADGRNESFKVTVGSTNPTASCLITFDPGNQFANAPRCQATDQTTFQTIKAPSTATTVTLAAQTDMHGDSITVSCPYN